MLANKIQKTLLIDDSEAFNAVSEALLNQTGLFEEVIKYSNPEKALLSMQKDLPDLILLDINMPEMNGFNFLDEYIKLNSVSNSDDLPLIIMVSGLVFSENFQRSTYYKKYGVSGYICKPIETDDITDLLEEHFSVLND